MSSSSAHSRFITAHKDAVDMLPKKTEGIKPHQVAAHKCRCALVFGVAAMDSYFTKKFCDHLTGYLKQYPANSDMKELMIKADMDVNFFLDLLAKRSGSPFREIHTRINHHLGSYTTQSSSKIDSLYKCYGMKNLFTSSIYMAKKQGYLKGVKDHKRKLNEAVERRNEIVHTCDLNSHGNYKEIKPRSVRADLELVKGLVAGANIVIDEYFEKL